MKNIKKAFDYVDKNFDSMIEELREVCSYRSVEGDQEGLRQTREYILRKMKDIGLNTELYEVLGGNPIIFSERDGMLKNTLLFYNHYDVVPEGPIECWEHHPFKCEIENGKLYARGVSDNKGGIFSRLHAIQAIGSVENELPIGVKFLVEGDEESCSPSLYKFAEEKQGLFKKLISADGCIWENGRKDENGYPWARFGVRGGLEAELSVKTSEKDIHERNGAIVPNAAWRLVWALASIKDKNENVLIEGFYDDVLDLTEQDKKVLEDFPYNEQELKDNIGIDKYLLDLKGYDLKKRLYAEAAVTINGIESGK
ncbi:MAG TPA: M20/M25/M40 family metallo-hydrolase, partial [Bacillota bacterium]|nr:M20/M25/M40 family metallo-hydrolase [Bacillota bacterium]